MNEVWIPIVVMFVVQTLITFTSLYIARRALDISGKSLELLRELTTELAAPAPPAPQKKEKPTWPKN